MFSPELAAQKKHFLNALEAASGGKLFKRLGARERAATPILFRDLLLTLARSVRHRGKDVESVVEGAAPPMADNYFLA
jgi:hypothetical protein